MFLRLFLFLSPPRTHALTHSLTLTHTIQSVPSSLPPVPLTVLGVLCFARAPLLPPRPRWRSARGGGREWEGTEGWGEEGGGGRIARRVTPTHHEPGTGPRVTAARGIALETATAALCRADVTSECRLKRERGSTQLEVSLCVNQWG